MIIDTHTHTYFSELEARQDEVVANMRERGVAAAVQIGCDIESSKKAIALAGKYPGVFYATAGFHPTEIQDWTEEQVDAGMAELEALIAADRRRSDSADGSMEKTGPYIVGIGET